jgi:hypothetical protein
VPISIGIGGTSVHAGAVAMIERAGNKPVFAKRPEVTEGRS